MPTQKEIAERFNVWIAADLPMDAKKVNAIIFALAMDPLLETIIDDEVADYRKEMEAEMEEVNANVEIWKNNG